MLKRIHLALIRLPPLGVTRRRGGKRERAQATHPKFFELPSTGEITKIFGLSVLLALLLVLVLFAILAQAGTKFAPS